MPVDPPALLIVATDWFARELVRTTAGETDRFGSITAVEDGHEALVEIWQRVIDGHPLPSLLLDLQDADASTLRLVHALREDAETRRIFVAVMVPPSAQVDLAGTIDPEVNLVTSCAATDAELPALLHEIGRRVPAPGSFGLPTLSARGKPILGSGGRRRGFL